MFPSDMGKISVSVQEIVLHIDDYQRGPSDVRTHALSRESSHASPLEGDGFELLVPRRKSRGFPQRFGYRGGIGGALKRYHLMVQPFFSCASNHSIEPG